MGCEWWGLRGREMKGFELNCVGDICKGVL